jgi:hypothetical protein
MKIAIALLIFYLVTSIIAMSCIELRWCHSVPKAFSAKREPRWLKALKFYCIPIGIFFILLLFLIFLIDSMRKIEFSRFRRRERPKTEIPFRMVRVFQENALAIGGFTSKFIGIRVGEFILSPDSPGSSSDTRPNDLQVVGPKTVLLVRGGPDSLLVRLRQEGLSYRAFQRQLSQEDKLILQKLAFDLAGWIWPDVGEVLRRRVEEIGEDKVLLALEHLFNGVEKTMKR